MVDLYRPEFNLLADAFLGIREQLDKKLDYLSKIAQTEKWALSEREPFGILYNYLNYTYDRLKQEKKVLLSPDKKAMCFNTGLLTKAYENDIYAYFIENKDTTKYQWFFVGFCVQT